MASVTEGAEPLKYGGFPPGAPNKGWPGLTEQDGDAFAPRDPANGLSEESRYRDHFDLVA